MAFQTVTINKALKSIYRREYVLPAIQRQFVWRPEQIERLFDSLMRGYPIGSFLFWTVERESVPKYTFYEFMLDYHQRDNRRCKTVGRVFDRDSITAILDGQQRLTALNIGLRGSYAYKLPRLWWNNPDAFPTRHLYLNLLAEAEENERGMQYNFRFLTTKEAARRDETNCWYRVGEVLDARNAGALHRFVRDHEIADQENPFDWLAKLHQVVHTEPIISFYSEEDQNLDKVLDIFIRTNNGGTELSHSDMLMSMATAEWKKRDAREEIHQKVDEINQIGGGFWFSKNFLLKAGLMLAGVKSVRFKVTNFTRNNMQRVDDSWDGIISAVSAAVRLVSIFGFSGSSLISHNAVLPIAHYLYRRGVPGGFLRQTAYKEDRRAIRDWLIRSLLKGGVWSSSLDSLLIALRNVIDEHGDDAFPAQRLEEAMRKRGKSLTFHDEDLEDLVERKDHSFALLSTLYPFVDTHRNKFHIDHVFPKSRFSWKGLQQAGVPEDQIAEYQDRADRLPNLQLLDGDENESKSDKLPSEWLATLEPGEAHEHAEKHDLGDVPADVTGFLEFYEARRARLLKRLRALLATDGGERVVP